MGRSRRGTGGGVRSGRRPVDGLGVLLPATLTPLADTIREPGRGARRPARGPGTA
jgi:hypothetical protein